MLHSGPKNQWCDGLRVLQLQRTMQTRVVETFAGHETQHDPHAQGETEQMRLVQSLGVADRLLGDILAFSNLVGVHERIRQGDQYLHAQRTPLVRIVKCLLQHARRLEETFGV